MKLKVNNVRDKDIFYVRVLPDARVADLKKEIAEERNWTCYGMRLIYYGYLLDNKRRLDSYLIRGICSSILVYPSKESKEKVRAKRRYSARQLLKHEVHRHDLSFL